MSETKSQINYVVAKSMKNGVWEIRRSNSKKVILQTNEKSDAIRLGRVISVRNERNLCVEAL